MKKNTPRKIPWWLPEIGPSEERYILKVLRSHFPNQGKLTVLLEEKLAKLLGMKYAVMTTSGTAALFLSLYALGVRSGDEVIVPDVTFIASANAVRLCGAKPVLVDVDPTTVTISPEACKAAITLRTKAIMPVHVSGRGADMREILKIAKKHKLAVVEDAAEGLLSKYQGKYLGTFGDAGCFSLSANKTITSGQGGFIVTNREDVFRRVREIKNQGIFDRGTGGDDVHPSVGFNFRYTDIQAAVALGQLSYLSRRVKRMRRTYELYRTYLKNVPGLTFFDISRGTVPQWTDVIVEERNRLDTYLREQGIDCRRFWHPLHQQEPYKGPDKKFPVSTAILPKALWLPSAFTLSDKDVKFVCEAIISFYKER